MQLKSSITHKKMSIDKNVWFVFIVTAIICIGFISYGFIHRNDCKDFEIVPQGIKVNESSEYFVVGESIFFKATLSTEKSIIWNFGDSKENLKSTYLTVKHIFPRVGTYRVSAQPENGCSSADVRIVIRSGEAKKNVEIPSPIISGNLNPIAGKEIKYISNVFDGKDYEWVILNKTTFATIHSPIAKFTFPYAGPYTIQLIIDRDKNNKRAILEINAKEEVAKPSLHSPSPPVFPPIVKTTKKDKPVPVVVENKVEELSTKAPETKPPVIEKNTIIIVGNTNFQSRLNGVIEGEVSLEDFDDCLYNKGNTRVRVNDKGEPINFSQFFYEIKGKKKFEITEVNLKRDLVDKRIITEIDVKRIDKRSFIKKIISKD